MEEQEQVPVWRIWVDTRRRVVSFHEEEGSSSAAGRCSFTVWTSARRSGTGISGGEIEKKNRPNFPLTNSKNVI